MFKSEFSIPFPSQTEAEVAYNSLRVEVEPSRSEQNEDAETNLFVLQVQGDASVEDRGQLLKSHLHRHRVAESEGLCRRLL